MQENSDIQSKQTTCKETSNSDGCMEASATRSGDSAPSGSKVKERKLQETRRGTNCKKKKKKEISIKKENRVIDDAVTSTREKNLFSSQLKRRKFFSLSKFLSRTHFFSFLFFFSIFIFYVLVLIIFLAYAFFLHKLRLYSLCVSRRNICPGCDLRQFPYSRVSRFY